ncbi:MAG: AAA family ATPase [Paludibacteraceae bacterium]|nr:AAA family ATPase [Paludibacteraceae bacterium]
MEKVFKRKLYQKMLEWKTQQHGQTALLIEGARRVGKSTLAQQFAESEYESNILIDFNIVPQDIMDLFNDLSNLDAIFVRLQQYAKKVLIPKQSVIVFDEVQHCPRARQAIKYLVQDGRYDYIETGSLISIKKNVKDITIPSEESRLTLYPMDYDEFRWALGDNASSLLLRQFYEQKMPLGVAHRSTMRDLRLYMLVGGMPQSVNKYIETNNLQLVDSIKRDIIRLYADDFKKLDPSGRLSKMFLNIPAQLTSGYNRYIPKQVVGDVDGGKMIELLNDLEDSKTVLFAHHASDPNVGMSLSEDLSKFKIFTSDTGLFVTLAFWDKDYAENVIYDKLLSDKLQANLGYLYENLVAQMLATSGNKLFYYTWAKDEKHNYEIDFLLSRGSKLVPIEVKSSGYATHKSLDAFCEKYSSRIAQRYLLYTKDIQKQGEIVLLPVYLTPFL